MVWSSLTRKAICLVLALWAGLVWYLFLVQQAASSRERNILAGAKVVGSRVRQLLRHDRALPASGTTLAPGAAHPCGKCYSGHVDGACCWEVRSNRVRAAFSDKPKLQWYAFDVFGDTESQSASLPVRASPLFHLLPSRQDLDCGLQAVSQDALKLELAFNLSCSNGLLASFSAWLPNEDSHFIRFKVRLWQSSSASAGWPRAGYRQLELWRLQGPLNLTETKLLDSGEDEFDAVLGLPVVVNKRFFLAVEHPMGVVTAHGSSDSPDLYTGQLQHLKSLAKPTSEVPWDYGFVIGGFSEMSQARRSFLGYLHSQRPGRRSPMVHYNSWYDFYSYQDEGFNGGFKDPWPNETLISSLRPDKMSEGSCLQRVEAFGEEVVRKRGAKLDSFLWDDGWDNPQTLWEFDAARFPRRFEKVASKAKEYGAGTGVWLSPWGGYGFTQEERVKYGKRQGYETNYNRNIQSEAFSLAGKKYRKAFHETAMSFRREQGVNMFKFDGVAGNPTELGMEMEAMLQTIAALRGEKVDKSSDEKDEDDVWINLTTGTWPSPFFLFWADSIWRGGPDIATRPRDWYGPVKAPDHFQKGRFTLPSLSQIGLDGLTGRQRWIRWRSMVVYMLVERRSTFFPLSQLMIHGVVVASHGDALHWELDKYDSVDFTQEVWSFVALGLQLQELYVAPRHMTAEAWDILAEALKWSRQHAAILRDSHWAFGDVTRYKVYCVASWDVVSKRGHMLFHNPSGAPQASSRFNLNEVLELPLAQRKETFTVTLVKSAFRPTAKSEAIERLPGWNCTSTFHEGSTSACRLLPTAQVQVVLEATEVLVLSVAKQA